MVNFGFSSLLGVSLATAFAALPAFCASDYPVRPVPFTDVRFTAGLLHDRQKTNVEVTLPFALEQLESSKRLMNFDLAADTMRRRAEGQAGFQHRPPTEYTFDDTDIYKVVEGAAYCLSVRPDPELQAKLEKIIARVAAAQEPDGYLYTFRTMHPDSPAHPWIHQQRWLKDPDLSHELYNSGHLYESATAYFEATKSRSLLEIGLKNAELVYRDLGDGQPRIAPGHQVIEMGLARLYRQTGDERWLALARTFLAARGSGKEYSQDHLPVVEQRTAVGHAVRANYMYAGMADLAALQGDATYLKTIDTIWENVVGKKLHLTGGVGARAHGEAYGDDYELPNRCYNETCAAIGFLYWNHRMFLLGGDSRYMDVFERTLYNGFLSGVSLSGDRFFYPNPLEYDGKEKNNHGHAGRAPWFGCACCPPNILRTLASLGGYAYAVKDRRVFVNLYGESDAAIRVAGSKVTISQQTRYPWSGAVKLVVTPEESASFALALRIPGWALGRPVPGDLYRYESPTPARWTLTVNGEPVADAGDLARGYAIIDREWIAGDVVELELPMLVRRVVSHEKIVTNAGLVALERGPVVYAFEGVDNDGSVFDLALTADAAISPVFNPEILGGVVTLDVVGARRVTRRDGRLEESSQRATAIPYAVWNNRGLSPMAVWLARDAGQARASAAPTLGSRARVNVSFARAGMDPARLNDQLMPRNATDGFAPNFDFWPHKGGSEWIVYEFAQPARVSGVTVSWFDDTGAGECRLPKAWRVSYRDESGNWTPVERPSPYLIRRSEPVDTTFSPVTTRALRLDIDLPDGFSAGLFEWAVRETD